MIRLLASELLRARSRRVVPMMFVGAIFGVLVGVVIGTITADPAPTLDAIEDAHRLYERELRRCLDGRFFELEEIGYSSYEEACEVYVSPEQYQTGGLRFVDLESLLDGTGSLVVMLGALLGSTLGGADWSTGAMTTLLTWEPRRGRVFLARSVAVAATVLAIAVVAQVWLGLVFTGAVAVKGTFALTPDGFLGSLAIAIGRVAFVATLFAVIGLALATIGRSSVAAVGAFLGYLVVVEGFVAAWIYAVAKIALGRAAIVATSGDAMQILEPRAPYREFTLFPGRAWVTVAVWVAVVWLLGLITFRGRDVT